MKQPIFLALPLAFAAAASFAALSDGDVNKALDGIKAAGSPRYGQYNHAKIVADMQAFAKTNELTYVQKAVVTRRLAEHAAALNDEGKSFEQFFGELNALTNAQVRISNLRTLIDAATHTYSFNRAKGWETALRVFGKDAAAFDANYRMSKRADLASIGVLLFRDRAKARYDELFGQVVDEPVPVGNQASTNAFLGAKGNRIRGMIQGLFPLGEEMALKQFDQFKDKMSEGEQNAFYAELAKSYKGSNNRKGFDDVLARLKALPLESRISPYGQILKTLHEFDSDLARKLLDQELAQKLSPAQRQAYLAVKQGFYDPPIFNYGFNSPGQYKAWRDVIRERIALEDANKDDAGARFFTNAAGKVWEIERMVWFDDLDTAEMMLGRSLALWPADRKLMNLKAQVLAIRGDAKGAAGLLRETLLLRGTNAQTTNEVSRVVAFLEGKGIKGFDGVNAPLALTSEQRLAALRQTSRQLFTYRRYDDCRAIFNEITGKMYAPDLIREHTATYMPNAPKSADGFVRTDMYGDWAKMETRFYPYGDCYGENSSVDAKRHLRDAEQPVCDEKYRTGVRVVYDDEGVHVFIRCDDPAIDEVKLGKRAAGELEMCFRPGDQEKPYHSIFFCGLPATDNPHDCEWAMPGRHYRRNADTFAKDAALTAEGVVAHLSIPWIAFYDDLPVGGNVWELGIIRGCPAGLYTIGGIVHEISRGMRIKFDFTPAQLVNLKRRVSVMAFNRYSALRKDDGKFIKGWNDKLLGDPDFYAAEVAPLLDELDKAGEELLAPCADKDVEKFFSKYAPLWAEIDYEIAQRRTTYLNDMLFKE